MSDNNDSKKDDREFIPSQTPTSATDYVNVAGTKDGSVLMQFVSVTPEYIYENHRTLIANDIMNHLIDTLCDLKEYYPTKPRKGKASAKPKKKRSSK